MKPTLSLPVAGACAWAAGRARAAATASAVSNRFLRIVFSSIANLLCDAARRRAAAVGAIFGSRDPNHTATRPPCEGRAAPASGAAARGADAAVFPDEFRNGGGQRSRPIAMRRVTAFGQFEHPRLRDMAGEIVDLRHRPVFV